MTNDYGNQSDANAMGASCAALSIRFVNKVRMGQVLHAWHFLDSFTIDLRVGRVPPPGLEASSRVIELSVELAFLIEEPFLSR